MPVVHFALSDLVESRRPAPRVRRVIEGKKSCAFCGLDYEPRAHERPERHCCSKPRCEASWQAAKDRLANSHKTPRPVLTNEPPRPLRQGNT